MTSIGLAMARIGQDGLFSLLCGPRGHKVWHIWRARCGAVDELGQPALDIDHLHPEYWRDRFLHDGRDHGLCRATGAYVPDRRCRYDGRDRGICRSAGV